MQISYWDITVRLVLALLLGGAIGLERESMRRPAGFRTHILVCIGSTLIMMTSAYPLASNFPGRFDPGRIAAQVVSGIGFIGAGTILREGIAVRGLTTAASLWAVAGIGLAIGSGFYFAAILTASLAILTLLFLSKLEFIRLPARQERLLLNILDQPGQLAKIFAVLEKYRVNVQGVELAIAKAGHAQLYLEINKIGGPRRTDFMKELFSTPGVIEATYI